MPSTQPAVADVLDALVDRVDFLNCLRDGSQPALALVDELDVARSTVDRAINGLETVQLIEQADNEYHITPTGQQVTTDFFDLADAVTAQQEQQHAADAISGLTVLETIIRQLAFLECLQDEQTDKRTLVDALGISRATVDRGVGELETLGLVAYTDGCFTVTQTGELAASGLSDLTKTITLRQQLYSFLKWVSDETLDLDLRLLADAELLVPEAELIWNWRYPLMNVDSLRQRILLVEN
jgi:predicted transcriptional regulator